MSSLLLPLMTIRAIIGLGNPGTKYEMTRHNIGFRIVDALVDKHHGSWQEKPLMETAQITMNGKPIIVIKPQTFMNDSGKVISYLVKQGIKAEQILVVHDELELPFAEIKVKVGGSAKGHNGLKSIIQACGEGFGRLRFGIGRPEVKEQVPDWVLQNFNKPAHEQQLLIDKSVDIIDQLVG